MAFANGIFSRLYSWVSDRDGGIKIRADRMDDEFDGVKDALNEITAGTVQYIGPVLGYDGTVSAPGYTFFSDQNTGIYRVGADNIGVSIGGVKLLDISSGQFQVTSADAGAAVGPILELYRNSASPAVSDILGRLAFTGEDSAGNTQEYASIETVIADPTSTSEDGELVFYVVKAGTRANFLSISATGTNFTGATAYSMGAPLTVSTNLAGVVETLTSTEAGATAGPTLDLYRNSASPAASDIIGQILFNGEDSAGNTQEYAAVEAVIADPTTTQEDGMLDLYAQIAGSRTRYLALGRNAAGTFTPNALGLPLGQLSFPATQNASSNANTLDDYEEGTWTPVITFGGASVGITYTVQTGIYTKIGNVVTVHCNVTLSAKGSSTGTALITGLPFAVSGLTSEALAVGNCGSMSGLTGAIMADANSTNIRLFQSAATGTSSLTDAVFTDTTFLRIGGSYLVAT